MPIYNVDALRKQMGAIDQPRRGWLESDDVLNTNPWDEIAGLFER